MPIDASDAEAGDAGAGVSLAGDVWSWEASEVVCAAGSVCDASGSELPSVASGVEVGVSMGLLLVVGLGAGLLGEGLAGVELSRVEPRFVVSIVRELLVDESVVDKSDVEESDAGESLVVVVVVFGLGAEVVFEKYSAVEVPELAVTDIASP